jgi:hypothetical protein
VFHAHCLDPRQTRGYLDREAFRGLLPQLWIVPGSDGEQRARLLEGFPLEWETVVDLGASLRADRLEVHRSYSVPLQGARTLFRAGDRAALLDVAQRRIIAGDKETIVPQFLAPDDYDSITGNFLGSGQLADLILNLVPVPRQPAVGVSPMRGLPLFRAQARDPEAGAPPPGQEFFLAFDEKLPASGVEAYVTRTGPQVESQGLLVVGLYGWQPVGDGKAQRPTLTLNMSLRVGSQKEDGVALLESLDTPQDVEEGIFTVATTRLSPVPGLEALAPVAGVDFNMYLPPGERTFVAVRGRENGTPGCAFPFFPVACERAPEPPPAHDPKRRPAGEGVTSMRLLIGGLGVLAIVAAWLLRRGKAAAAIMLCCLSASSAPAGDAALGDPVPCIRLGTGKGTPEVVVLGTANPDLDASLSAIIENQHAEPVEIRRILLDGEEPAGSLRDLVLFPGAATRVVALPYMFLRGKPEGTLDVRVQIEYAALDPGGDPADVTQEVTARVVLAKDYPLATNLLAADFWRGTATAIPQLLVSAPQLVEQVEFRTQPGQTWVATTSDRIEPNLLRQSPALWRVPRRLAIAAAAPCQQPAEVRSSPEGAAHKVWLIGSAPLPLSVAVTRGEAASTPDGSTGWLATIESGNGEPFRILAYRPMVEHSRTISANGVVEHPKKFAVVREVSGPQASTRQSVRFSLPALEHSHESRTVLRTPEGLHQVLTLVAAGGEGDACATQLIAVGVPPEAVRFAPEPTPARSR